MKSPNKSVLAQGFSLVELLVVIAVIAVIAAIAIPNISDITGGAAEAKNKRNAQNIASVAAALRATGYTNAITPADLIAGVTTQVPQGSTNNVSFRVDGIDDAGYAPFLATNNNTPTYNP
jgi:type IV pilus assembly protein PilA